MAKLFIFYGKVRLFLALFFCFMVAAAEVSACTKSFSITLTIILIRFLQNSKQILENKLIVIVKGTSSQIAVVLVPTTGEYEIADYTFALGDKWGIGRKNLNNGVLMLIGEG